MTPLDDCFWVSKKKDIDKCKERQANKSTKKIRGGGEIKKKVWNRGKQTQMPVTITEGLAATGQG